MLKAFLTLIRWPNLLIVGGIQGIVFYTLLDAEKSRMPFGLMLLLIGITLCITAAGNVINDYHDSAIDEINRPKNWVAGNKLSHNKVLWIYKGFIFAGAAGALLFAWTLDLLIYFPVYLLAVVGLQVYSTHLKCRPVIGNVVVAMYCGAVVLVMGVPDMLLRNTAIIHPPFWYYIFFAFLITFYREIIKDIEDVAGDRQFACKTFVVRYGLKAGKMLASFAGGIALCSLLFWDNAQSNASVGLGLMVLQGAIIASLAMVWWAREVRYYRHASSLIKFVMIGGTLLLFIQY